MGCGGNCLIHICSFLAVSDLRGEFTCISKIKFSSICLRILELFRGVTVAYFVNIQPPTAGCFVQVLSFTMRMQVAGAAAVVAITALKLTDINVQRQGLNVTSNVQCLLGSSDQVGNLCYYAYAVAGFSLLASVALSLVQVSHFSHLTNTGLELLTYALLLSHLDHLLLCMHKRHYHLLLLTAHCSLQSLLYVIMPTFLSSVCSALLATYVAVAAC